MKLESGRVLLLDVRRTSIDRSIIQSWEGHMILPLSAGVAPYDVHLSSHTSRYDLSWRMTNSQELDARKLPLSPRYVVESYSDEEEPTEEPTEDSTLSQRGILNVSIEEESIEDEPMEDEPMEDEQIEDEPTEDEPTMDEPMEEEPEEDESKEEEPKEDANEEPSENRIYGLVNQNDDEEEVAWRAVSDDDEPFNKEVPKEKGKGKGSVRAEDHKRRTLQNIKGVLEKMRGELDTLHQGTRLWTVKVQDTRKEMIEGMVSLANKAKSVVYYLIDWAKERPEPSKKLHKHKTKDQEDEEKKDEEDMDDQEV
nr:hypothetical protein [Tanacetum cinerariifolium]